MNTTELEVVMLRHNDTGVELAKALSISPQTLSSKKNGSAEFTQGEISQIKERYNLTADDIMRIFFTDFSS